MSHDFRAAWRSLLRHRAFTALAVTMIALGIAASTAVFSVVRAILLRPLPYPEADRLVDISHMTREGRRLLTNWFDLVDLRLDTEVFEGVAARMGSASDLVLTTDGGQLHQVKALWATHDYLSVLGAPVAVGRLFTAEDAIAAEFSADEDAPDPVQTAVITHGLWLRMFGGDTDLPGLRVALGGYPVQVIGVLPPDFRLLHERRHRWVEGSAAEIFLPVAESFLAGGRPEGRQGRSNLFLGRLREGVTYERAQASLDALAARYRSEIPYYGDADLELPLYPLRDDLTAGSGGMIRVLAGGLVFLMLLVCANVANLLLVRGRINAGEDAIRASLGCGSRRLMAHKLWESAALGVMGGALGLGLGWLAVKGVAVYGPRTVPLLDQVTLDLPTLAFSVAVTLSTVLAFGSIPALQTLRLDPAAVIRAQAGRAGSKGRRRLMQTLVVGALALSTVLLSGALVMVRSMAALTGEELGFDPDGLVTFGLMQIDDEQRGPAAWEALMPQIEERVAAIPGVASVARVSLPPFSGIVFNRTFGRDAQAVEGTPYRADVVTVGPGYFDLMGTRRLAGRAFDERDLAAGSNSIIVDATVARLAWPGEDPLGDALLYGTAEGTVVGVVESMLVRDYGSLPGEVGAIYQPERRVGGAWNWVVRTTLPPSSILRPLREAVAAVDPGLTAYKALDLSERIGVARAPTRFVLLTLGAFALVAFVIAVGGLFGVISYGVRTRTVELGLRSALGADRSSIRRMVVGEGVALAMGGLILGLGVTLAASRILSSVAYGVSPTDPVMLGWVAVLLGSTSILACYVPARWASAVDPVKALTASR